MSDFSGDAQARYDEAVARRDAIRAEWEKSGSPLLASGSTGQLVEHPLVKMLREHDALCDRLGRALKVLHRGPNASAVVATSVGKSPAAELRAVG